MSKYFVILAAGKGNRFKSNIPKQYLYIYGKPILQHSIDKALKSGLFKKNQKKQGICNLRWKGKKRLYY